MKYNTITYIHKPINMQLSSKLNETVLFPPLYGNMTSSTKPEVHNVALPTDEDRSTAISKM